MLMPKWEELVDLRRVRIPLASSVGKAAAENSMGGHRSLFKGRGLDFAEFREYAPGDDIRSLDWRVTARTGKPHTKVFTEERERSVYVVVDVNSYMQFGTRRTFKNVQAARAAALLVWLAHHRKDKTGALLFGAIPGGIRVLPAKKSRRSIWEFLRMLTEERAAGPVVPLADALREARRWIPAGSSVFVLSDFFTWNQDTDAALAALAERREVTLVKVSDPADRRLPQVEPLQFLAEGGAQALIDTQDLAGGRAYGIRAERNEAAFREAAARFGLSKIYISTEDDAAQKLLTHLHPRARKVGSHE